MTTTPPTGTDRAAPIIISAGGSAAAFLALVPMLVGFVPGDSLVVVGTRPPRDRVAAAVRLDLHRDGQLEDAGHLAECALTGLMRQNLSSAVAAIYGSQADAGPLAAALLRFADRSGIYLHDVLRVENGRYWSATCGNPTCCPAEGTPFAAALPAALASSQPVLPSRAALVGKIAPLGGQSAAAMWRATVATLRAITASGDPKGAKRAGLAAVQTAIAAYRADARTQLDDSQAARILLALSHIPSRDVAWAHMDPAHADAHIALWTALTRRAPAGLVAAPASLLAFTAWQSGDGALANVAVDRALADNASYSLARLIRDMVAENTPPPPLPSTPEELLAAYEQHGEL
jgi:uncharacterized protein DUF4192